MQNLLKPTDFIRGLKERPLGFSAVYMVPHDKTYNSTCNGLTALASREGIKISTSPVLLVDPALISTLRAIQVTRK